MVRPDALRAHGWRLPLALASTYLVWGSTYLAIRFALHGFPPLLLVGLRYTVAGGLLAAFLIARGAPRPTAGQWLRSLPIGVLLFVGGNGFVATAERDIGSGLAAVVIATMPLFLTLLAALGGERPSRREVAGLLLGLGGVVVLSLEGELRGAPLATALLLLAALSWACGSVLGKRLALPAGAMAAALQMTTGGLAAGAVGLVHGERLSAAPDLGPWLAFAYLVVLGSWCGFVAYAWLLTHARPAVASSYAFVNPLVALVLGALLGAERFGWQTAVAVPLIAVAVALVVTRKRPPPSSAPAHSTTEPQGNSASRLTSASDR